MTIEIPDHGDVRNIAIAVRQLKGVAGVKVHQETAFKRIPGLPYTQEERIESATKAMAGYRRGEKGMSQQELRQEAASWK